MSARPSHGRVAQKNGRTEERNIGPGLGDAPDMTETAWADPREQIAYSVLRPDGRLAGRSFASREEAEAWARPDEGEQVVAFNLVCDCDM